VNHFEGLALQVVAMLLTANQATIDATVDGAADKIISAVHDTDTKFDDVAAKAVASSLKRLAERIEANV
jgi:hypothetical protein